MQKLKSAYTNRIRIEDGKREINIFGVKVRNHKTCLLSPNDNTDNCTLCRVTEYTRMEI
jgi:hypothetical protein